MGVNPTKEGMNSSRSWKQRYQEKELAYQNLRREVKNLKSHFEELQIKIKEVSRQLMNREEEISEVKRELREANTINLDKEKRIIELKKSNNAQHIKQLEEENKKLQEKVENLLGHINRAGIGQDTSSDFSSSPIQDELIPMLLQEYDPENYDSDDTFINLVESIIKYGDPSVRIVAILIKYGGGGPINKIKDMVGSSEFQIGFEDLVEQNIIQKKGDRIVFADDSEDPSDVAFSDLSTDQLFDKILQITESQSKEYLIENLKELRDILQGRDIPLTTIFFEIRKMIERIEKGRITRKDIHKQVTSWKLKYENLSG